MGCYFSIKVCFPLPFVLLFFLPFLLLYFQYSHSKCPTPSLPPCSRNYSVSSVTTNYLTFPLFTSSSCRLPFLYLLFHLFFLQRCHLHHQPGRPYPSNPFLHHYQPSSYSAFALPMIVNLHIVHHLSLHHSCTSNHSLSFVVRRLAHLSRP